MDLVKYLLFGANLVFMLGGLIILLIGAVIQWNLDIYNQFFGENVGVPLNILLATGGSLFFISFFGCCGAIRESQCMLLTYSVMLGAILTLQLTGATLVLIFTEHVDAILRVSMKDVMRLYQAPDTSGDVARKTWDVAQIHFQCCGVGSFEDWLVLPPTGLGIKPPISCTCTGDSEHCKDGYFREGCYQIMTAFIYKIKGILAAVALFVAAVEFLGVTSACIFAAYIKKRKSNKNMKYFK